MSLTLGMTGMDSDTEAALKAAVEEANTRLKQPWQLLPDSEADHVVVDMDSMYGPMSWLRLHAAGKRVIGLTSASRTQTDFHLLRPFDANSLTQILEKASASNKPGYDAVAAQVATTAPAKAAPTTPASTPPAPAQPVPELLAPEPPAPEPPAKQTVASKKQAAPSPVAAKPAETQTTNPSSPPAAAAAQHEYRLANWLEPGRLSGRHRYQPAGKDPLLIDTDKGHYHGPTTLKPLAGHFEDVLEKDAFVVLDDAAWAKESAALGAAQPLSRLQWYAGLVAGKGTLLHGSNPDGRYKLGKWPQTEREFPKHFRLATTMMKGPATIDEIAAASGVARDEVIDFINANLVSGFAELDSEAAPEPAETSKSSGLFGRLRGK